MIPERKKGKERKPRRKPSPGRAGWAAVKLPSCGPPSPWLLLFGWLLPVFTHLALVFYQGFPRFHHFLRKVSLFFLFSPACFCLGGCLFIHTPPLELLQFCSCLVLLFSLQLGSLPFSIPLPFSLLCPSGFSSSPCFSPQIRQIYHLGVCLPSFLPFHFSSLSKEDGEVVTYWNLETVKLAFFFLSISPLFLKSRMKKCFSFFKEKTKNREAVEQRSAPASTSTTRPVSTNATGTSRSSGSSSTKQTSKSSASLSSPRSIPALYEERGQNLRVFDFRELRNATNDFSRLLKIGEGGFGSVYKGFIKPRDGEGDRIRVAIKKLNQSGLQGHKQWLAEVLFLGVVDHPNLVKLIGYCALDSERGKQRLLVYEFMPNKSLEDHLFNSAYPALPWDTRLKIAMGVAEGLSYLHEGLEVQVIYRDFKASNILLDEAFKPKLSDFGLAREGPSDGRTHVTTAVVGTYGYAAPDYVKTGHLTIKSDVWSFGVVLFEILAGRRSLDRNRPKPEQTLLEWVKQFPVESRRFSMIMDPRLGNQYSLSAARLIAKLANTCLSKNPNDRPSMSDVIGSLKHAIQVTESVEPTEPSEEQSATDSDGEEKTEQVSVSESAKRRMLHLAKLEETANAESRRKFVMMQRVRQT